MFLIECKVDGCGWQKIVDVRNGVEAGYVFSTEHSNAAHPEVMAVLLELLRKVVAREITLEEAGKEAELYFTVKPILLG